MNSPGKVLDPCCGGKSMWFSPDDEAVTFCDIRCGTETYSGDRILEVSPDLIADVTALPFEDGQFNLVVFDPPHLTRGAGWQVAKYGKLPSDWKTWMTRAFAECWRVLAVNGTLVFKWYEYTVSLKEVLACAPARPLFGNRRPKLSKTHWMVFFKSESEG